MRHPLTPQEALEQAIHRACFGHALSRADAKTLLDAYFHTTGLLGQALIDAERHARDATTQRALVECLTNELDKREQR